MDMCRARVFACRCACSVATLAMLVALLASRDLAADGACERVRGLTLRDSTISAAQAVAANTEPFFAPRAFCRVLLTIAPTDDSDIKAEVWLPARDWNGKFQAVGNSDAAGVISYDDMV